MNKIAAFTSSFTPTSLRPHFGEAVACPSRPRIVRHSAVTLQGTMFMPPQPGDAGYKSPKSKESESKKEQSSDGAMAELEEAAAQITTSAKRGLELLKEDLFKTAPERAGVGRQDEPTIMKPQFGEPGYKAGDGDDSTILSDVKDTVQGVISDVKDAVSSDDKKKTSSGDRPVLKNKKSTLKTPEEEYDLPAYLKPLPEDTPRKGFTWKNYNGR